jgi:multidrug resistance efflux pump
MRERLFQNRLAWKLDRYRLRARVGRLEDALAEERSKVRAQDRANAELRAELLAAEATVEILSHPSPDA